MLLYKVIKTGNVGVFNKLVNEHLVEGWELFGSPFNFVDCGFGLLCQAMTKYESSNCCTNKKEEVINSVIEELKKDAELGDFTVLDELLKNIPTDVLIESLPEEMWGKFGYNPD